ncbi:hypothetical protein G6011_11742 [Alternaria panax]|uniref:Uncharacterized protein n=1 Tax=Alternaria panax TaxID=48097 RepID=A0AAD4F7G4_9PLEO|nr:hypothetical protein G6011_11742 [Alternaria panax]
MSGAFSPGDGRPHSASAQDGSKQAANSLWTEDECLFIQLQAELALAAASLPVASALLINGRTCYQNFCRFFNKVEGHPPEVASQRITSIVRKSEGEYCSKQEELVALVVLKIRNMAIKARKAGGSKQLKWWTITPEVFDEYRKIREIVGYDKEVRDPRDRPEMWMFLDRAVRERFPESCTPMATSASAEKSQIPSAFSADDIAPNSLAHGGTSRNGPHTDINVAPASDDPPVVETTRLRTTTIVRPTPVPDVDIIVSHACQPKRTTHVAGRPEMRLGPEDFAKETGSIICTTFRKDGHRCTLHAPKETPEGKRPTYICHIHQSMQLKSLEAINANEPKRKKVVADHEGEMKLRAGTKRTIKAVTPIEEEREEENANKEEPLNKRVKLILKLKTPGAGGTMRASDDPLDDGGEEEEVEEGEENDEDDEDDGDVNIDDNDDEEEEEEDGEGEPTKKHTKSASKNKGRKGKGHSANRAQNNPWHADERQVFVDGCNKWIAAHGLVSWVDNFTIILNEACDRINEYRPQHPEKFAGRATRGIHAVRSQALRGPGIEYWRSKAEEYKAKIANGETIEDATLKPTDLFDLADFTPKSQQKVLQSQFGR